MVRKFKYHEQKLLKKVNFIDWDSNSEHKDLVKYGIQKREDYTLYCKLARNIRELSKKISLLSPSDTVRLDIEKKLLEKVYNMGLIHRSGVLSDCVALQARNFCKRRLPIIMVKNKMAEYMKEAIQLIEQGHVKIGIETVSDPAFLISRTMEDFISWSEGSAIKRKILNYNDKLDDYDLCA